MVRSSLGSPLIRLLGVSRPLRNAQIKMARAALNLTLRDLAKATGVDRNAIANIEVGRYAGNQDSIALIDSGFRKAGVEVLPQSGLRFHEPPDTNNERGQFCR